MSIFNDSNYYIIIIIVLIIKKDSAFSCNITVKVVSSVGVCLRLLSIACGKRRMINSENEVSSDSGLELKAMPVRLDILLFTL